MPAVLNAANEVAVGAFLGGKIGFNDIAKINGAVMKDHSTTDANTIEQVIAADRSARSAAEARVANISGVAVVA